MSKSAKQAAAELRKEMVAHGLWPCCLNCEHWRDHTHVDFSDPINNKVEMRCSKYKIRPPDETIVIGCNQHLPYIPF